MLLRYAARRLLAAIPVLLGVTIITFLILRLTSGGFVPGLELNPSLRTEDVDRIRHNLGLDAPLPLQYLTWLAGLLHGDFGRSLTDGQPVLDHILERLPNTVELTLTAVVLAVLIAIPLGVAGALRRGTIVDHLTTALSVAGVAVPAFWLGLLLILVFSVSFHAWGLPWLPSGGAFDPADEGDVGARLLHLVMPATVLAFGYLAVWSRYTRSSMLEVLAQDYVRTALAKGMSGRRMVAVHALRNAVAPLITLIGLELPTLVGGAAVVEIVFGWPGIGQLALERALDHDYTTLMGLATFTGIAVVAGNLVADVLYAVVDPRIRL
ncbi:MAG: ABC transporter permease [Chloroflexi bacterium]|nr:MAG: ABC transporter permease [Chloroflexota bacterium]